MLQIIDKDVKKFWSKVDKTKNCWEWTGRYHKQGYGFMDINKKGELTHRISWVINRGKIPKGICVLHKCDNPKCVNPDHLFLGTHTDNMRDMVSKGRRFHTFGENTPHRILNDFQVIEIKKLLKLKFPYKELAKAFGVSRSTINDIVSGYTWNHIL